MESKKWSPKETVEVAGLYAGSRIALGHRRFCFFLGGGALTEHYHQKELHEMCGQVRLVTYYSLMCPRQGHHSRRKVTVLGRIPATRNDGDASQLPSK